MVRIRPYAPADWPRLCKIHDAARLDELRASIGVEAFLSLEQTAENEGLFEGEVRVAEAQGAVQGFVAYTTDELAWLYVDPEFYRNGVGRALVRHAVAHSTQDMTAEVLEGNRAALSLYLSEGFKVVKRVEGKLEGNDSFTATGFVLKRDNETRLGN